MRSVISFRSLFTLAALGVALVLTLADRAGAAAPAPEEFFGIKWGASKEEVKEAMTARNQPVVPRYTSETNLVFSGGTAAGLDTELWDFCFVQGKFYRAYVFFKEHGGPPEGLFNEVKRVITEKYGERQKETYKPNEPSAEWHPADASGRQDILILLVRHTKSEDKRLRLEYKNLALKKLVPGNTAPKSEGL